MFLYVQGRELSLILFWVFGVGVGCVLSPYTKQENGEGRGREREGDMRGQRGKEMQVFLDGEKNKKLKYVSMLKF